MTANEALDTVLKFIYNLHYTEFTEENGRAINLSRLDELMSREGLEAFLDDREFNVFGIIAGLIIGLLIVELKSQRRKT